MNVAEWEKRLSDTFKQIGGVVGGNLLFVINAEQEYRDHITKKFHGYLVLTDSFFSFYLETLFLAEQQYSVLTAVQRFPSYAPILLAHVANFRGFRAAEILLVNGYPLSGYALLRDLKDKAIFLAAIACSKSTYDRVYGLDEITKRTKPFSQDEYLKDVRNRSKVEQSRVMALMLGKNSGLQEVQIAELRMWAELFHQEVHGAKLTTYIEGKEWMEGRGSLPLLPRPEQTAIAMYLNRSHEIGWMLLRTLPFLQLKPSAFGEDWARKWIVLDDSFREAVRAVADLGKPAVSAVIDFIEAKFPFKPAHTFYTEPPS